MRGIRTQVIDSIDWVQENLPRYRNPEQLFNNLITFVYYFLGEFELPTFIFDAISNIYENLKSIVCGHWSSFFTHCHRMDFPL